MPMGIVSDDQFDTEIVRVSKNPLADGEAKPARPDSPLDNVIPLSEEISDYEPKEVGITFSQPAIERDNHSTRMGLRELESSGRTNEAETEIYNHGVRIHQIQKGRPEGRNNRTPEEREIIAGEALINGNKATIEKYGIAGSTLSAFKRGSTSTSSYNEPDDELLKSVSSQRLQIAKVAHGKLSDALDQITHEKLAVANLRTIASVAQSMSAIVKNMEPEQAVQSNQNIQFTFYAPKPKSEESFDVIDMRDEG